MVNFEGVAGNADNKHLRFLSRCNFGSYIRSFDGFKIRCCIYRIFSRPVVKLDRNVSLRYNSKQGLAAFSVLCVRVQLFFVMTVSRNIVSEAVRMVLSFCFFFFAWLLSTFCFLKEFYVEYSSIKCVEVFCIISPFKNHATITKKPLCAFSTHILLVTETKYLPHISQAVEI